MKSFLRWNGGKRDRLHIISRLLQGFPCGHYSYVEPCVGGGSVYWAVGHRFRKRHIGDIDGELINLYRVLQTDCEGLLAELGNGEYWYHGYYVASKLNYHRLRDWEPESPVQRAARFLFLNQTCINGLMRVNGRGRLNAAPGKTVPRIDPANLRACAAALRGTEVFRADAIEVVDVLRAVRRAFLLVDPPYHDPRPGKYTAGRFTEGHQVKLARAVLGCGHPFIYTNKATELTSGLFAGLPQFLVPLRHKVGPARCRGNVEQELWVYRL
jgi:DNA adenine methylase